MAALTNGRQTVTVPDETIESYLAQGWRRAGEPPAEDTPTKPKTRRRKPSARRPKGETNAPHAVRVDRGSGSTETGP